MMQLINGDCLEVMQDMPDNFVDLCISSPPYNLDIKYNTYKDKRIDYIDWQIEIWNTVCKKLKDTGHLFLNIQPTRNNYFMPFQIVSQLHWKVQNIFIWNKSIQIDGLVKGQSFAPRSNRYIANGWEYVFHITTEGNTQIDQTTSQVPYNPQWAEQNEKRFGKTHRPTVNTWFIPYETVNKATSYKNNIKHPAIFPKQLVKQCINISSIKNGILFDPFLGIGTTGIVAKELGFDFIGIEIDKDYFDLSGHRIQEASKS